jgi:acyl-coenzyme A thioesterase PaaI-like protein
MAQPASSVTVARERLRAAVSRVVDVFVSRQATAVELNTWADISEQFAASIEDRPPETVMWGYGSRGVMSAHGVVLPGKVAAPAPQAGDSITATVTFGQEHEGHRGFAHGGAIAAAFDDLFGMLQLFRDPPIVTAELTIRYLVPVPLRTVVQLDARVDDVSGRRVKVSGRATFNEGVCDEAEAVFMTVPRGLASGARPE